MLFSACKWSGNDLKQEIQGKWVIDKVFEDGRDMSSRHNEKDDRYITFKPDGQFESGGGQGQNAGTYAIDEHQQSLMIDSDAGEGDDSHWLIYFYKNRMVWQGIGSDRQRSTQIYLSRSE